MASHHQLQRRAVTQPMNTPGWAWSRDRVQQAGISEIIMAIGVPTSRRDRCAKSRLEEGSRRETRHGVAIRRFGSRTILRTGGRSSYLEIPVNCSRWQDHPYRVRAPRGPQFRRLATERLNKYMVKAFTMNGELTPAPTIKFRLIVRLESSRQLSLLGLRIGAVARQK